MRLALAVDLGRSCAESTIKGKAAGSKLDDKTSYLKNTFSEQKNFVGHESFSKLKSVNS